MIEWIKPNMEEDTNADSLLIVIDKTITVYKSFSF
jgi:hypothetical protein